MNKQILILTVLILTIITLFGVRTGVSNMLSTSGVELGRTQDEVKKYKTDNALLREKVFSLSSLSHVASAAGELGFVNSKSSIALSKAKPIAIAQ